MMTLRRCAGTLLVLAGCVKSQLNTGGKATAFDIATASTADSTRNHPANSAFQVSASCPATQQMVGGGYQLINNNAADPKALPGQPPIQVAVEASFPSSKNTWTVQARNPDNPPYSTVDADVVVQVVAYCLTTPNYALSTDIAQTKQAIAQGIGTTTELDVRCAQSDAIALSGGFSTTTLPTYTEPGGATSSSYWPGLRGTGITEIGPRLPDATHSAMGWHVTQQYTPGLQPTAPQTGVTTTLYVLCARKNLNAMSHHIAGASAVLSTNAPIMIAACGTGELTVGGGYDGFPLTFPSYPSGVSEVSANLASNTPFALTGWQIAGETLTANASAQALCVTIPQI